VNPFKSYPNLRTLANGATGHDVRRLQHFLAGKDLFRGEADGRFGSLTLLAVKAYQTNHGLNADGIVGGRTYGHLMLEGIDAIAPVLPTHPDEVAGDWPDAPDHLEPLTAQGRERTFGKFSFRNARGGADPDEIEITDDWEDKNIVPVMVPALRHLRGERPIRLHRMVVDDFQAWFAAIESAGLAKLILSFDGGFFARYTLGSKTVLSPHAWGTAIDINAATNGLGVYPPEMGGTGKWCGDDVWAGVQHQWMRTDNFTGECWKHSH